MPTGNVLPSNNHDVAQAGVGERNAVLKNTYRLLSMTLAFSGLVAFVSVGLPAPGLLLTLGGYFGLLFLVAKLRNSYYGLLAVFGLTGFMGYTLGPILNHYLSMPNGAGLIATSMVTTALAFIGLSWFARSGAAPDMMRFSNFLFIGVLTAFALSLVAIFTQMPMLSLAISGLVVLLMSGLIMYETQNIVNGGETNYIMATVTLFVAIFNMFTSLLHLMGFLGEDS